MQYFDQLTLSVLLLFDPLTAYEYFKEVVQINHDLKRMGEEKFRHKANPYA